MEGRLEAGNDEASTMDQNSYPVHRQEEESAGTSTLIREKPGVSLSCMASGEQRGGRDWSEPSVGLPIPSQCQGVEKGQRPGGLASPAYSCTSHRQV